MKLSKADGKYLSEEGFLSLIIGVVFVGLTVFSRFALGSNTLTNLSTLGSGVLFWEWYSLPKDCH